MSERERERVCLKRLTERVCVSERDILERKSDRERERESVSKKI